MTFRWFGDTDPVSLENIRQIPCVKGIVSALYDIPAGEAWPVQRVARLAERVSTAGLDLSVIESIPVHEDIKLGLPTRDLLIDNYAASVRAIAECGVQVLCYNFMPVFDWLRTDLDFQLPDGSSALAYSDSDAGKIDLSQGTGGLPGWAAFYTRDQLTRLMAAYRSVGHGQLWENLHYFLERIVPVAQSAGVKMAIHPDDPPWDVFGLPRIIVDADAMRRVCSLVDSPANGVTFCTGSLGANPLVDLPALARELGAKKRIHFAHCRNVRRTGERSFHEAPHTVGDGDVDLGRVLSALHETGFTGPMRPDHGRMIWGEKGRPGYGLHDRALGAMYLTGIWEGLKQ